MNGVKKILAPVDFSEICKAGVRQALELGQAKGAEVIVYHVIGPAEAWLARHDELFSVAELVADKNRQLEGFLAQNFADFLSCVAVRAAVEVGLPHKMIVAKAQEEAVDLIVMSTQGASGLGHLAVGSVTEKVVGRAPCPVLSVCGAIKDGPGEHPAC
jgi:nucleotide-binding universal stress UspA family protein